VYGIFSSAVLELPSVDSLSTAVDVGIAAKKLKFQSP
jgi:hypothetical protein